LDETDGAGKSGSIFDHDRSSIVHIFITRQRDKFGMSK
jgi:hypothetical protein